MNQTEEKKFIVYRSSAGSGKTYTLVKEYLRLALNGSAEGYRHILAVTFTNKAAAEMKNRILLALVQFSNLKERDQSDNHLFETLKKELQIDGPTLQSRSKQVLKEIIHHYADFGVSTIDKFTHKIVRTFSHDLKFTMGFDVEMDEDDLLYRAIEQLVAQAGKEKDLTTLLLHFTQMKVEDDRNWQVERDLFEFAKVLVKEDTEGYLTDLARLNLHQFNEVQTQLKATIQSFIAELQAPAQQALDLMRTHGIDPADLAGGSRGIGVFFLQFNKFDFKKISPSTTVRNYVANDKWCAGKLPAEKSTAINGIANQLRLCFETIVNKVDHEGGRMRLLAMVEKNLYPLALLSKVELALQQEKQERNVVAISDFNKAIARVVNEEPIPFIYERIGERYHHFLIDEFQDTSVLQWNNLLPLIENALGSGHYNMIVGDAKQSIYRWRGGEVEQFVQLPMLHKADKVLFADQKEQLLKAHFGERVLKTNFRSKAEVVQFNNAFFSQIVDLLPEGGREIYRVSGQEYKTDNTGGGVVIETLEKETYAERIEERVLKTIEACLNDGYRHADIAILCRRKSEGNAMAALLVEQGVPVVSAESLLLSTADEVQLLLHTLRMLQDPENRQHPVKVVEYLVKMEIIQGNSFDLCRSLQDEKEGIFVFFSDLGFQFDIKEYAFMSLYETAESLLRMYGLFHEANPYLLAFLDQIHSYTIKLGNDVVQFLKWWEQKQQSFSIQLPEGTNAVQIMTVHKSKGLEFPVVIHPFATYEARIQRQHQWVRFQDEALEPIRQFLIPLSKSLEETPLADVYQAETEKALLDMLNLMYVAFTRPTDRLYLFTQPPTKQLKNRSVADFIAFFSNQVELQKLAENTFLWGQLTPNSSAGSTKESSGFVLGKPESHDWKETITISYRSPKRWQQEQSAVNFGNVMHEVLGRVHHAEEVDFELDRIVKSGLLNEAEGKRAAERIKKLLGDERIRPLFDKDCTVLNEFTILSPEGGNQRPDRVVLFGNEAVLLDYKTGVVDAKHQKQLQRYGVLLEQMGYRLRAAYLLYIGEEEQIVQVV